MAESKNRYWFVYYGNGVLEGNETVKTIISTDYPSDFIPLREINNYLNEGMGSKVAIKFFAEISRETYLDYRNK